MSIKLVLRTNKQRADGTAPVYLRIIENRKASYQSTGVAIEERHWNAERQEVRKSHPRHKALNDALEVVKGEAQDAVIMLRKNKRQAMTAQTIKKELAGAGASHFFPYARDYSERLKAQGGYWTPLKLNVVIGKVRDFHGSEDLTFAELDHRFVGRFEGHMRVGLKNRTNTVAKNLQMLRCIVKQAIRDGLVAPGDDPFLYHTVKTEPTGKSKLSIEEVRRLESLDLPAGSPLALARDAFLFSFYCAGIRFGDLCRLTGANVVGGRLTYRMGKTGTPTSLKLLPQALDVLKRYGHDGKQAAKDDLLFPILERGRDYSDPRFVRSRISSRNAVVNKDLKALAKLAEIEMPLSFHVSRHSFADYARKSGMNVYAISKALRHSTLKQTETYLSRLDHEAVDAAMDELFG